jgi:Tfp pilus assembly protein FimT
MKYFQLPRVRNWSNRKKHAFCTTELIIALSLIAFITALSIPLLSLHRHKNVYYEALYLKTTCWYLRQRAIAENKDFQLTLNEKERCWSTAEEKHKLSSHVKFGVAPDISTPLSDSTSHSRRVITFKRNTIVFLSNGLISPGSVSLVDEDHNLLYALTVPVGNVPHIHLYSYTHGSWQKHA